MKNKSNLENRIAHISELLNCKSGNIDEIRSQLPDNHPLKISRWNIDKTEENILLFDNEISKRIVKGNKIDETKYLFNYYPLGKTNINLITDFKIGGWIVDYFFFNTKYSVKFPFAIGVDVSNEFSGWWARHPRLESANSNYMDPNDIRLFFVTPDSIYVNEFGLNQDNPRAIKIDKIDEFKLWIQHLLGIVNLDERCVNRTVSVINHRVIGWEFGINLNAHPEFVDSVNQRTHHNPTADYAVRLNHRRR